MTEAPRTFTAWAILDPDGFVSESASTDLRIFPDRYGRTAEKVMALTFCAPHRRARKGWKAVKVTIQLDAPDA